MNYSRRMLSTLAMVLFLGVGIAAAQQTSTQETIPGQGTTEQTVRSGEVVDVDGNNLFVRLEDGQVKHFTIPPDFKFKVDGQEVGVSELKPGTKLTQTIKTTKTPQTVRTTTSIKGKVWYVAPPKVVILTMPGGVNKKYTIPEGQKFTVEGQQLDAFALKKGMNVDATVVREVPEEIVTEDRANVSGEAPPEPVEQAQAAPPPQPEPAPAAPQPEPQPEKLPQTASPLPLLALMGGISVIAGIRARRSRR